MSETTSSLGLKLGGKFKLTPQAPSAGSPAWEAGDPVNPPQIWPNTLDGAYIINGVIQSQPPHVYVAVSQSNGYPVLPPTNSYYWASTR